MSHRPARPVISPSKPLPEDVARLVERLVQSDTDVTGPASWDRYEHAKRALSELCGPLAGSRCNEPVFQRALHAYMLGVCL